MESFVLHVILDDIARTFVAGFLPQMEPHTCDRYEKIRKTSILTRILDKNNENTLIYFQIVFLENLVMYA